MGIVESSDAHFFKHGYDLVTRSNGLWGLLYYMGAIASGKSRIDNPRAIPYYSGGGITPNSFPFLWLYRSNAVEHCSIEHHLLLFIDPGSPWENWYIESFNGRFRDELLNGEIFDTVIDARIIIER